MIITITHERLLNKIFLLTPSCCHFISGTRISKVLGRPLEVMVDMSKSRKLGFKEYQNTEDSFTELFEKLKAEKLIP